MEFLYTIYDEQTYIDNPKRSSASPKIIETHAFDGNKNVSSCYQGIVVAYDKEQARNMLNRKYKIVA